MLLLINERLGMYVDFGRGDVGIAVGNFFAAYFYDFQWREFVLVA